MSEQRDDNAFEGAEAALRQSWEVHRQAFGPILEPAFVENQQVRLPLIAALNHISRREVKRGLEILQSLKDQCIYDEDKAAWTFFVGLCFEMAGAKEQMLRWYEDAGKYGHRFYLPYLKLAKAAHNAAQFDKALKNYASAIECLLEMREEERDEIILASAYTNLTSCLTMMHRYGEAEQSWQHALRYPRQPGAAATAAILYAAMGKAGETERWLEQLKKNMPLGLAQTKDMTRRIISGEHPHFCRIPIDARRIGTFWDWFSENEQALARCDSQTLAALKQQLKSVFPFLDREPQLTVAKDGGSMKITFADFYAVGLHYGYGELLSACPEALRSRWIFAIIH